MKQAAVTETPVNFIGPQSSLRRMVRENAQELLALLGGAMVWEALGWGLGLQWLPPFSTVMDALGQFIASGVILANLGSSLQALVLGFAVSLVFGLVLGSLMGRYRAVEKAFDVYVHALFVRSEERRVGKECRL